VKENSHNDNRISGTRVIVLPKGTIKSASLSHEVIEGIVTQELTWSSPTSTNQQTNQTNQTNQTAESTESSSSSSSSTAPISTSSSSADSPASSAAPAAAVVAAPAPRVLLPGFIEYRLGSSDVVRTISFRPKDVKLFPGQHLPVILKGDQVNFNM
jgi:cobalamin biosynthesis Mg chelatase CobN